MGRSSPGCLSFDSAQKSITAGEIAKKKFYLPRQKSLKFEYYNNIAIIL